MINSIKSGLATRIFAATVGFAIGYIGFTALVGDEMTLHRVAAGSLIGVVGAMAASGAAEFLRDRHGHGPF